MKIDFFHNEFPLFVLLAGFICLCIRPSYQFLAPLANDIIDTMETSHQHAVLGRPDLDVHAVVEEVCSPVSSMKALRDYVIMTCEMSSALGTCIDLGTV